MSISRLAVQQFRNITLADLSFSPEINLIYGENGSGKTSILEAISLLGMGRSFRSHKYKTLINRDCDSLTIFSKLEEKGGVVLPLGVSRFRNGTAEYRAAGESVPSAAELAKHLPVQVIEAHTFSLLEGSPNHRRQFMDWLVFHVEPEFYPAWKAAQKCLKQRNSLLKRGSIEGFELAPWDLELIQQSEVIRACRQRCFDQLKLVFEELCSSVFPDQDAVITFYPGWERNSNYAQVLEASRSRDIASGYTHNGVHRADLRIKFGKALAIDVLSRGQQKLLVCALKVAQGILFNRLTGRRCVYLVDDLPSELDSANRGHLASWLKKIDCQVFVTGVDRDVMLDSWSEYKDLDLCVFHVKHGKIEEEKYPVGE